MDIGIYVDRPWQQTDRIMYGLEYGVKVAFILTWNVLVVVMPAKPRLESAFYGQLIGCVVSSTFL